MSMRLRTLTLGAVLIAAQALSVGAQQQQPQQQQPQQPQQQRPQQRQPLQGPSLPQNQMGAPQQGTARDFQQMRDAARMQMRERIAAGIQRVQSACANEIQSFCGNVTPGEGRLLMCMQAHEDKISNQCGMALFEASRNIEQVMHRIERIADACWDDIQRYCASGGGSVARCVAANRASLSPQCQAVVATYQPESAQTAQPQQPSLTGLAIYSSDGMKLGEITAAKTGLDGKVQLIQADMGSLLGLGTNAVLITPDELEWRNDRMYLRMSADQVRTVLQQQAR